ncbi:family 10 glycosylhydrolase [Trichothermofontia sichuanensis B231]|uniref:family 10 glycosylhydrolase n=1 Tax=Trichothermofontia sichuanensis TaxID=3045816 RepID=UPI00224678E3|nr:family 10 glycosylhydrolase [Trichothermofontia sichuanensis]UZQ55278.1 family 10 glycosylhydrolase [Trichothermofontia sichuanensis B231]
MTYPHPTLSPSYGWRTYLSSLLVIASLVGPGFLLSAQARSGGTCVLPSASITEKEQLRQAALQGGREAQKRYEDLLRQHARQLQQCRERTWPKQQALWLRLYPCDAQPGQLEALLDEVVNKGYNQVYVEAFYDGQVLLPLNENRTAWPSVIRNPQQGDVDLLAQAIHKGRQRGLKVYAWVFTINFGYSYGQRPDRQQVLARNGQGQVSLQLPDNTDQAFVDPYHPQARQDYTQMLQAVLRRRPDGILFDYIRYPRGTGGASIATRVQDLWVYGEASQAALIQRGQNNQGRELIQQFLRKGYITEGEIAAARTRFPQEPTPLWPGRDISQAKALTPPTQAQLQRDLWILSVSHAAQGVVDFLTMAAQMAQQHGIPAGAVFFPGGNQVIGQGFDSRLQPWDQFPAHLEWHPMSYSACGSSSCVVEEVRRVLSLTPPGTLVRPALAGSWGGPSQGNRPSLEVQMQALQQSLPQLEAVSHFAYSWQEPESDRRRRFCRVS